MTLIVVRIFAGIRFGRLAHSQIRTSLSYSSFALGKSSIITRSIALASFTVVVWICKQLMYSLLPESCLLETDHGTAVGAEMWMKDHRIVSRPDLLFATTAQKEIIQTCKDEIVVIAIQAWGFSPAAVWTLRRTEHLSCNLKQLNPSLCVGVTKTNPGDTAMGRLLLCSNCSTTQASTGL